MPPQRSSGSTRRKPRGVALFDVQAGFGGATPGRTEILGVADLQDELCRLGIGGALVRIVPEALDTDVMISNAALYAACKRSPSLIPCPIVVPSGGHDLPPEEEQVAEHVQRGAGAVWIRPGPDCWLPTEWCAGRLFAALEARCCPVVCLERLLSLGGVAELAERHPFLPIVLAEVGYRSGRSLLPLLERFRNVHLSLGAVFSAHGGIEQFVSILGPERLLFGTGFPEAEPMAAVTQLLYSPISIEQKRLIGTENFGRLQREIIR